MSTLCVSTLCDHSMWALYVWPLYVSTLCLSTLCVTALCEHPMCENSMWPLYMWALYVLSTLCVTTLWALYVWALYVWPLYVSTLCVTTLCEHSMSEHSMFDHSMWALYVWPLYVRTLCLSTLCVTTLCENSIRDHSICEPSMCEHSMCDHSMWPFYVSTLCVTTLCEHSMSDHSMWALYVWVTMCEHSTCEHDVWALYLCDHSMWAFYVWPLYVSTLCVSTLPPPGARTPKSTRITTKYRYQFLGRMLQNTEKYENYHEISISVLGPNVAAPKTSKKHEFYCKNTVQDHWRTPKSTRITTKNEHRRSWRAEKYENLQTKPVLDPFKSTAEHQKVRELPRKMNIEEVEEPETTKIYRQNPRAPAAAKPKLRKFTDETNMQARNHENSDEFCAHPVRYLDLATRPFTLTVRTPSVTTLFGEILSYKIPCDMSYMSSMEPWSLIHPTAWGSCRKAKNRKLFFQLSGIRSENCCRSQPLERRFPISIVFFGKGRWDELRWLSRINMPVGRFGIHKTQSSRTLCFIWILALDRVRLLYL